MKTREGEERRIWEKEKGKNEEKNKLNNIFPTMALIAHA